jgi:predicted porin
VRKYLHAVHLRAVLLAGLNGMSSAAHAADIPSDLTWYGVTLYGIVDVGVSYQTHGSPLNSSYAQGLEYGISSNSNRSYWGGAPNGLSQSRIGLTGSHEFAPDWSSVFALETRFSPLSGELADGPKSLTQNNGVPPASQSSNSDSSQAGQAFTSAAYAGVNSGTYGSLTLGRQYGLLYDNILKYDPNDGAYAFSLIGFSAVAAGSGDSEYNRLAGSVKYAHHVGPVRIGAQYQPAAPTTGGLGEEFDLGAHWRQLSLDAVYVSKHDAIALGTYSPTAAQLAALIAKGLTLRDSLKATLSNNKSAALMARYHAQRLRAYAGYEHIAFANPDPGLNGIRVGSSTIGGDYVASITSTAYTRQRILQVAWGGLKYSITPKLILTGALYHYDQNSYATGRTAGCSSPAVSNCGGTEIAYSWVLEYQFNQYFDLYGGFLRSRVRGGLSSGFLNDATTSTTTGIRVSF